MMALGIWNMGEARAAAGEAWVGQPGRRSRLVGLTGRGEGGASGLGRAARDATRELGNRVSYQRDKADE